MSHFPSSSFEWASMTNKEYMETNSSCFSNLFENVAARCTYPSLALMAIIETIGSAVAALFVSISIPFSGNSREGQKQRAFSLWQRSAFSGLAITLDVLGFFSPLLTSTGIEHITSRFFHEEKEQATSIVNDSIDVENHVTPIVSDPNSSEEISHNESEENQADAVSNNEEVEEIEESQSPEEKNDELKGQLLNLCRVAVIKQTVLTDIPTDTPIKLQTHLLEQSGYNKLHDVQEQIGNLETLIAKTDLKSDFDSFFKKLLAERIKLNGDFSQKWKENSLPGKAKEIASPIWKEVFTTDMDVEKQITEKIDIIFGLIDFDFKLSPLVFMSAVNSLFSSEYFGSSPAKERLEQYFRDDFWDQRVVTVLGLTDLFEDKESDNILKRQALLANLPQLGKCLCLGEKMLGSKVNGKDEIATAEEIRKKMEEIFIFSVKEKACQPDAKIPKLLSQEIGKASQEILSPIKEKNEETLEKFIGNYDRWAQKCGKFDPNNPPSLPKLAAWDMKRATKRMQPHVFRQRVEEVFTTHTTEEAKEKLLAANSEKVTWAQNYTEAQSSVIVSNEHQDIAAILELGSLLELDKSAASVKEYQEGTALLNNLPQLVQCYKTIVDTLGVFLTAEQPTADETKEIADGIFSFFIKKEACQTGGNIQVPQDKIEENAKEGLKSIRAKNSSSSTTGQDNQQPAERPMTFAKILERTKEKGCE